MAGEAERRAAFRLLGLDVTSTRADVVRAYRRLARRVHPDVCFEPDAAQRFALLNGAYRTALSPVPDPGPAGPRPPERVWRMESVATPDLRVGPVHYTPWASEQGGVGEGPKRWK